MKRKRTASDAVRDTIQNTQGLHSVSDESRCKIFNAAAKALGHGDKTVTNRVFNEVCKEEIPEVFVPLDLPTLDDNPLRIYTADIKKTLQAVFRKCPNFAEVVRQRLREEPGCLFDMVLYNDEASGGNILQPDSSKKVSLWYFCLQQAGFLYSDSVWHPLALLQHRYYGEIAGGFAGAAKLIIQSVVRQNLSEGFPVQLSTGPTLLRLRLRYMISDLDSIRGCLDLKGSAAIRCCMFCRNCLKRGTSLEEYNNYFQDVGSHEFEKFELQTDADLFLVVDQLFRQKAALTKAAFKKKEQCAGINVNEHSLLADLSLREEMPPSSFLLDVLHIYWSNGVCSWEVNCLYWLDQEHGVGDLAEFLSLDWKTTPPCSPSYRKTIGHESNFVGASYKGSAANLQAFLPLYHYFLERCFGTGNDHKDKMESLRALRRITMELRQLSHST